MNSPDYGGGAMGLFALIGFLGALGLLGAYRTTRNKRYLRASGGAALLAASAIVYVFDGAGVLCWLLLLPGVYLLIKTRRPFF